MAAKPTPDVYCEFRMNKLEGADERLFAFQEDTGLYLSKCTNPGGYEPVEAKNLPLISIVSLKFRKFKQELL